MIGDVVLNAILNDYAPTGASKLTAGRLSYIGVPCSRHFAMLDEGCAEELKTVFESVGNALNIPPALLAASASRESSIGKLLDVKGNGDNGHAFGIMQIDRRSHTILGEDNPKSILHVDQAAHILKSMLWSVSKNHKDWSIARQLQGAVAAYNVGSTNVRTLEGIDKGTTHDDYSNDVWARAQYFAGIKV